MQHIKKVNVLQMLFQFNSLLESNGLIDESQIIEYYSKSCLI